MSALPVGSTRRIPFSRLVRVEVRKACDTRAGLWLLLVTGACVLLAEAGLLLASNINGKAVVFGDFVDIASFITAIMLPVLGIMLVTGEWSQRTAIVTFTLEPRRRRLIISKLVAGVLLTLLTTLTAVALGVICNAASMALQGRGSWQFGWDFLVGFLAVQTLTMAGGFAIATLSLNTPTALVVFFVYKWALPGVLFAASETWDRVDQLDPWINFQDALSPLVHLDVSTAEQWGQLAVSSLIWFVAPLSLGLWRVLRAEVR
jgi:ABC-type transport system involved in multi-copper enzyme maturation permease subunit